MQASRNNLFDRLNTKRRHPCKRAFDYQQLRQEGENRADVTDPLEFVEGLSDELGATTSLKHEKEVVEFEADLMQTIRTQERNFGPLFRNELPEEELPRIRRPSSIRSIENL